MQRSERAVLTVLLRGPWSAVEIRQRTDRLHTFSSLEEVEETLTWFIDYPHGPLVRRIPVGEGRRVEAFVHLLSPAAADGSSGTVTPSAAADTPAENDWRAAIEARLASLEAEMQSSKPARRRNPSMGIRESVAPCQTSTLVSRGRIPSRSRRLNFFVKGQAFCRTFSLEPRQQDG